MLMGNTEKGEEKLKKNSLYATLRLTVDPVTVFSKIDFEKKLKNM